MTKRKKYSQAVADLFPETGGWVDGDAQVTLPEVANKFLDGLVKLLGSETKAREFLKDIPEIYVFLPKRKRGRPATATQKDKDNAFLEVYDWLRATKKNNSKKNIARIFHDTYGIGANALSVERKIHRLLRRRSSELS